MRKILLFDFDGTLADTGDSAIRIYNEIARENNYKLITKDNLGALRNQSAMDNVRNFGIPLYKLPYIVTRVRQTFKNEIPDLKAISGITEPLKVLKQKGYGLYIVSSNSKVNIADFLGHNQISEFDGIFSVSNFFGKHIKIKHLLKVNKWPAASVMYIGDEVRDIVAAKKANITSVAVLWGYNTEEVLQKFNPDIVLRKPSDLASL